MTFERQAAAFYRLVVHTPDNKIRIARHGYPDPAGYVATRTEQIATLHVPTGQIIACDPSYWPEQCPAFVTQFPQGAWPLLLCAAVLADDQHRPYLFPLGGVIQFRAEPPQEWEMALCSGQDVTDLAEDEGYGFGVDGGRACFMDAAALEPWWRFQQQRAVPPVPPHAVDLTPPNIEDIQLITDDGFVVNVVSFQAGYGDGCYPCFVGFSAQGDICVLLMLFDVFDAEAIEQHPAGTANNPV
jgi:hypothetical protein